MTGSLNAPFTVARAFQANGILRSIAIAIAVAGAIDPGLTMSGATRPRLAIVAQDPASAVAARVRARLVHDLRISHEIVPEITSDSAAAIVIGDRYPDRAIPEHLIVATVTTAPVATAGARIVRVDAPPAHPASTIIHLDVDIEALGLAGRSTDVTATIGGLEVGRASHVWHADRERWRAGIDVVPIGEPPWIVRVAIPDAAAATGSATVADAVVDVRRSPFRVHIYEPRPSWATTFVRRALEADARFEVAGVSVSSRGISVRTGDGVPLTDRRLDATDVIVAGGLDRLSAADVRSLDRFMRERGGAVALVPDLQVTAGPLRDLLSISLTERLLERPAKLSMASGSAAIEASELLLVSDILPGGSSADVLAKTGDGSAIVVSMARGRGRLLVSGAMDAWRFRAAADRAFDRFWQSTVAGLALASPPPIEIRVAPPLLRPLEKAEVTVRVRSGAQAAIAASVDGGEAIRLLPEPEAGVFRGTFTARKTPGRMTIDVQQADPMRQTASQTVLVPHDVVRTAAEPALSMLAFSRRGIDVTPDRVADLERFVRGAVTSPAAATVRRPMRPTWWVIPFAACLSAEWWLRRRRGRR
jgi:hypothetical protein